MPFGMSNACSSSMRVMTHVSHAIPGNIPCYLFDDILDP